jgi:hypothetical protein
MFRQETLSTWPYGELTDFFGGFFSTVDFQDGDFFPHDFYKWRYVTEIGITVNNDDI